MKTISGYFQRAAELIATGHERNSCCAVIASARGRRARESHLLKLYNTFAPADTFWIRDFEGSAGNPSYRRLERARGHRIMMLLFVAAFYGRGTRK